MVLIFDETDSYNLLLPITYNRSYYDIVIGALSLRKKTEILNLPSIFIKRNPFYFEGKKASEFSYDSKDVIIEGSIYINSDGLKKLSEVEGKGSFVILSNGKIIGYTADLKEKGSFEKADKINLNAYTLSKPYDIIKLNKTALHEDIVSLSKNYEEKKISNNKIGKYGIYSNGDFYLENNAFFDTRSGPVIIEEGAYIQSFSRIEGPTYIGKGSEIVSFCNIRKCYIGNNCIIGGELSNSIVLDYTNCRHSSYIGDSFIGTWVNVGAHTVTSNLKHTYGTIKYDDLGVFYNSGLTKLGAIISDFCKTSIGCLILSGKAVGFSSMVNFLQTKSIPSFTIWQGLKEEAYEFYFESAVETAKRFMSKKGVEFSEDLYKTFRKIFEITKHDRAKFNVKRENLKF